MVRDKWALFSIGALIAGCNVAESAKSTPGVNLADTGVTGSDAGDGAAPVACARGVSVVSSDYQSTNVSVLSPEGKVLSESIISSGSAPAGLTTPLSGDVVVPGTRPLSGKLVTIDRTNAVLTWIDVATGGVQKQQSVGTGFPANPHDYLEVSDTKAYVSRYETNSAPGKEPFDDGGDVVVLDLSNSSITANMPLAKSDDGEFLPRPSRMLLSGHTAWVMLERLDAAFSPAGSSRIAGIDTTTDTVSWMLDLPDAGNCGGMAQSPSGKSVIVSCSGGFDANATGRALVLVDATADPPRELKRFSTASVLDAPLAPSLAFAVAYGDTTATRNDSLYSANVDTGEVTKLTDAGAAFALGDVLCSPGCTDLCFLADAELKPSGASTKGALRVYDASGKALPDKAFAVDPSIGLPPRSVGAL
jgi:hypothetical protein